MLRLEKLTKSFGGRTLFEDIDWHVPEDTRIGIVGPNGIGKTTLFRIMAGEEEADRGEVIVPRGRRIGFLPQEVTLDDRSGTPLSVVQDGAEEILALEDELRELEERLTGEIDDPQRHEQLTHEYGELQEIFRQRGGYSLEGRARAIATGVGFAPDELDEPIETFSGGWQMRAMLGRILMSHPDVLLLDEPTNHLDLETIEWLEGHLRAYEGTVLIISHDRAFLNRMIDMIAELGPRGVDRYHGNYDHYIEEKQRRREQLEKLAEQQQKEIAHIEEFIERFRYKASKAAQVQSRIKRLEKMDVVEVPPDPNRSIHFQFPQPMRSGKIVVRARELHKSFGDNVVYDGLDLELLRGEKVALVGPNGAGKTTALRMIAGVLEPDAGELEIGHNVDVAYFAQHAVDQLEIERTVLEEMRASASPDAQPRVRSMLGAFGFSGDAVDKKISVLSGGEKSRLALCKMLLEPANLLLLDEPTNHLDIDSRRTLESALKDFEGTFCVVSHDRYFLNEVVTKIVHIEQGRATVYNGDYDYYRWKQREEREEQRGADEERGSDGELQRGSDGELTRKQRRQLAAELRRERSREAGAIERALTEIEEEIAELEERAAELESTLGDPSTYEDDSLDVGELQQDYHAVQEALDRQMEQWEERQLELDEIDARYREREEELGLS